MNEFFRCLAESNPFAASAVSEARDAALHVEAIHQGQLGQLVASAEKVRATRRHRGLVLWGEAGSGKSHLLAQLRRWGEHDGRACCLSVHHLATDSDAQPWYVVKAVIRQLTGDHRGSWRQTPLARLVREAVKQALAELASMSGRAMILCFDPVDGLAPEQVRTLAQFLPPLIDHARNLLVILSGEQRTMLELVQRRVIAPAVWDRFAQPQGGILLSRISAAQARMLLEARLREFVEPFLTLPAVRRRVEQDPLFPLGSDWFDEQTRGQSEFRPRDVIHWAQDRWGQQQAKIRALGGAGVVGRVFSRAPGCAGFLGRAIVARAGRRAAIPAKPAADGLRRRRHAHERGHWVHRSHGDHLGYL